MHTLREISGLCYQTTFKNSDPIHILSSEKRVSPNSVKKYYADNNLKNNIKFHYINSSFEEYLKRIESALLKIENKARDTFDDSELVKKSKKDKQKISREENIIDETKTEKNWKFSLKHNFLFSKFF